jgi:hypothetical protein
MHAFHQGYRSVSLIVALNWDRLLFLVGLGAALWVGAEFGALAG